MNATDLWNGFASTTGATATGLLPMGYIIAGSLIGLFFVILIVRAVMAVIRWLFRG